MIKWTDLTHKFDLCLHTHGCRVARRNSPDIWFCMRAADIWSLATAFHDRRSRPRTSSSTRAEILRIRTVATNRNTVHGCRLIRGTRLNDVIRANVESERATLHQFDYSPQILSGASSSSRMGCERKISRDFKHNPRISDSVSWTFFPGLEPRTRNTVANVSGCIGKSKKCHGKKVKIGPGVGFTCSFHRHWRDNSLTHPAGSGEFTDFTEKHS